jgi:hypothetical protein
MVDPRTRDMDMDMRIAFGIAVLAATPALAPAAAQDKACATNYKQDGGLMAGRRFSTFEVLPDVAPDVAYKRIYQGGIKAGLSVGQADREMGVINFQQTGAGSTIGGKGQQVTIPWNVAIEAEGKGSRITVSKLTPPSYPTSADAQKQMLCNVVDEARNK